MKNLFIASLMTLSFNTFATEKFYDHITTNCNNGTYQLNIEGKKSFLDSRTITVYKGNQEIISESYKELYFQYSDKNGSFLYLTGSPELIEMASFARTQKPSSYMSGMEYYFRVSSHTIVYQTDSPYGPDLGADSSLLILQIKPSKNYVVFKMSTQCKITNE